MAATEILLTSTARVKEILSISDNLAGKYLRPAIREAQDIGLREITGSRLLDKLKALVGDGTIYNPENIAYKDLLDIAQNYLDYKAAVEVCTKVAFKVVNFGVAKTRDENMEGASWDEVELLKTEYQSKADHYCLILQQFILQNYADYPEVGESDCARLKSTLMSAASSGLWLGGARGKIIRR